MQDVFLDNDGNYWAGTTENGLLIIKPDGTVEKHNDTNGFLSNSISGVLDDKKGNIWILTSAGLTEYQSGSKTFRHFTVSDGLQGKQFTRFARLKAKDGNIYIGGFNGFNIFQPENITISSYIPPVYIDEFLIFNEPVTNYTSNSPLKRTISETDEIILSYKQSFFSFGFTAVNFTYPEKVTYAYKMDGYDNKWNYTNTSRRYATYTNLDPGQYTFMVKATNNDGIWNEKPTTIKITITPPYWKTKWFISLSIFFIIGSAFLYYKMRTTQLKRQKQLLEVKVNERTSELENANNILVERQEEILQQNEEITRQKEVEEEQHAKIEKAYQELALYENQLEEIVEQRTKELLIAKQKAEESDKLKSSFLANLSHEIRTPLNAIIGFSDLLIDGKAEQAQQEMFKSMIQSSSDSLLNLINDILDFSKIEAGQIDIVKAPVNLSKIVTEIRELYNIELSRLNSKANKKIDFRIIESPELIDYVLITDENRLKQILQNLISNAIKFTIQGSVEVSYNLSIDGKLLNFNVKDTGIGISKENQDVIFGRFRKIENPSVNLFRGTGIGLSICKHLVKLLDGKIKVESELGQGSIFSFTIPIQNKTKVVEAVIPQNINPECPDFIGKTILFAEDDDSNYILAEIYLKKTKVSITRAVNGLEAVEIYYKNQNFDMILMDIKMPIMDGFEALKRIKSVNPQVIVIAQTAHAYHDEIERIKAEGFTDYLLKPINAKKLYSTLQLYLEK